MAQEAVAALQARCDTQACRHTAPDVKEPLRDDVSETIAATCDVPDTAGTMSYDVLQASSPGQSSTVPTISAFSGLSEKLHDTACGKNAHLTSKEEHHNVHSSDKSCTSAAQHPSISQQEGTGTSQPVSSRPAKTSPFMAVCEAAGLGLQQRLFSAGRNMQVSQQRLVEMQQELMAHPEVALITPEACTSVFWSEHAKMREEYLDDLLALETILTTSIASKSAKPEAGIHHEQIKMVLMYLAKKRDKVNVNITRAQLLGLYRVRKVVQNYVQLFQQIRRKRKSTSTPVPQPLPSVPAAMLSSVSSTAAASPSTAQLKRSAPASVSTRFGDSLLDSLFPSSPAHKKARLDSVKGTAAESSMGSGGHPRKSTMRGLDLETAGTTGSGSDATRAPAIVCSIPLSQPPLTTMCSSKAASPPSLFPEASSSNLSVFSASIIRSNPKWPATVPADSAQGMPANTQCSISEKYPTSTQAAPTVLSSVPPTIVPPPQRTDRVAAPIHTQTTPMPVPGAPLPASPAPPPSHAAAPTILSPVPDFFADLDDFCVQDPLPTAMSGHVGSAGVQGVQVAANAQHAERGLYLGVDSLQPVLDDTDLTQRDDHHGAAVYLDEDLCVPDIPNDVQPVHSRGYPTGHLYPGPDLPTPDLTVDMHVHDCGYLDYPAHMPESDTWHYPVESHHSGPVSTHEHFRRQEHHSLGFMQEDDLDAPFLHMLDDFMQGEDASWSPDSFPPEADASYECWTPEVNPQDQYTPPYVADSPGVVSSFAGPPQPPLLRMLPTSMGQSTAPSRQHTPSYYMPQGMSSTPAASSPYPVEQPAVADVAYFTNSRGRLQPSYKMRMQPRPRHVQYTRNPVGESIHWHAQGHGHHQPPHQTSRLAPRGL